MNRELHPGAWWAWALALAVAASQTSNPLLLGLIMAVAVLVAVTCRADGALVAPLRLYLVLAALVVVLRVAFRLVFAAQVPGVGPVLLDLPTLRLPGLGLDLFGQLRFDSLYAAVRDALRLAALIICVGAAGSLASPKKTLAALPGALRHVGTAVVVALTVFPQLALAVARVRRTAALRGRAQNRRLAALRVVFPVLADSLDRSLELAASLEARGYGHGLRPVTRLVRHGRVVSLVAGTCLVAGGAIAWTGALPWPRWAAVIGLVAGVAGLGLALRLMGLGQASTRYRVQRWSAAEWLVLSAALAAGLGLALAAVVIPGSLHPPDLAWPGLPWPAALGLALAALPLALAPRRAGSSPAKADHDQLGWAADPIRGTA